MLGKNTAEVTCPQCILSWHVMLVGPINADINSDLLVKLMSARFPFLNLLFSLL